MPTIFDELNDTSPEVEMDTTDAQEDAITDEQETSEDEDIKDSLVEMKKAVPFSDIDDHIKILELKTGHDILRDELLVLEKKVEELESKISLIENKNTPKRKPKKKTRGVPGRPTKSDTKINIEEIKANRGLKKKTPQSVGKKASSSKSAAKKGHVKLKSKPTNKKKPKRR